MSPAPAGAVLALDLGLRLGWALRASDGSVTSGVLRLDSSKLSHGERFLAYMRWLRDMRQREPIARVYFEEVHRHMGVDAAHCYGALWGILAAWSAQHESKLSGVGVGVWRRYILGSGASSFRPARRATDEERARFRNLRKQMCIAAMRERGHNPQSDDEADALAILEYVCRDPATDPPPRGKSKRARPAPLLEAAALDKPF